MSKQTRCEGDTPSRSPEHVEYLIQAAADFLEALDSGEPGDPCKAAGVVWMRHALDLMGVREDTTPPMTVGERGVW